MSIDFARLNFSSYDTLLDVDLLGPLLSLAKAYQDIDPIKPGQIKIVYPSNLVPEKIFGIKDTVTEDFCALLQAGCKPLNAIAFYACYDKPEKKDLFAFEVSRSWGLQNQMNAVKMVAAAVLIFITRGYWPGSSPQSEPLMLPRFCNQQMKLTGVATEGELRDALIDYDWKNIKTNAFFEGSTLKGWNQILGNRLILGAAGHKPLKVAAAMYPHIRMHLDNNSPQANVVKLLLKKERESQNGLYASLHPSSQIVATKFKRFYAICMRAIYDLIPETEINRESKLALFAAQGALRNDELFRAAKILEVPPVYRDWNLEDLSALIGEPVILETGAPQVGRPIKLQPEEQSAQKSQASTSRAAEKKPTTKGEEVLFSETK